MWETPDLLEFIPEFKSGKPELKTRFALDRQPITGDIRKIHLYHNGGDLLYAMRFFDAAGTLIYESAWKFVFTDDYMDYIKMHEILL